MTEWFIILAKAFWCGLAALGFGILFNAPNRTLLPVWLGGFIAGFVKFVILHTAIGTGVIVASFAAALSVGCASLLMARWRAAPPMIFAIPSVIPLVPGVYAYKTMLGLIKLTGNVGEEYPRLLSETVHHGAITLFVILVLTLGVAIPMHTVQWDMFKKMSHRSD